MLISSVLHTRVGPGLTSGPSRCREGIPPRAVRCSDQSCRVILPSPPGITRQTPEVSGGNWIALNWFIFIHPQFVCVCLVRRVDQGVGQLNLGQGFTWVNSLSIRTDRNEELGSIHHHEDNERMKARAQTGQPTDRRLTDWPTDCTDKMRRGEKPSGGNFT